MATYIPQKTEDAPAVSGDSGVPILAVRNDAGASKTSTDNDYSMLAVDAAGRVGITDMGGSITVDGAVTASVTGTVTANAGTNLNTSALALETTLGSVLTELGQKTEPANTQIVGDAGAIINLDASGDVQVDVLTLPALVAGTANIGDVDIASAPTGASAVQVQGTAAHDATAVGNPVLVGAQMETMADSAPGTRSTTDGEATKLATADGALFVIPTGPQIWSYHENSSSALTDTSVHSAPSAGLSLYVTDIVVSTGAATALNVFFEEGSTTVLGPYYLEAVAGRGLAIHLGTPKKITAATALTITTSAAIAHGIDVTGFIAPG